MSTSTSSHVAVGSTSGADTYSLPDAPERTLSLAGIESQLGFLQGEILTLAEASIPDKDQCKAFKDLTKQFFRSRIRYIDGLARLPDDKCGQNPCVNIG